MKSIDPDTLYPLYSNLLKNLWEWRKRMALPGFGNLGDHKTATLLGLTIPTVRNIFAPKSAAAGPRLATIQAIADKIGIPFSYLLFQPHYNWDGFFIETYGAKSVKDAIDQNKIKREDLP